MTYEVFNLSTGRMASVRQSQLDAGVDLLDKNVGSVKCNICGYESDLQFLDMNGRKNEICPNCKSIKRNRYIYFYLTHFTDFLDGKPKVLHTAPENGIFERLDDLCGDDYITSDVKRFSPKVKELVDIQDIPFDDNYFDFIISSHVMEHVPDDFKALSEFYRVLKPGGMALILIPALRFMSDTFEQQQINTPSLRTRYYKQFDHLRYYSVKDFFDRMESVGFRVLRDHENIIKKKYPSAIEMHRMGFDPLFVGIK
ncbi:MAG: hypothetical protein BZ136_09665 [Methanosphaera sp. rholeuAM74]|nr:MAG: hypothetical protein BZ136_09665 [Methanosphaera sp. rholeuAM74]